jgi:hypothetical protein
MVSGERAHVSREPGGPGRDQAHVRAGVDEGDHGTGGAVVALTEEHDDAESRRGGAQVAHAVGEGLVQDDDASGSSDAVADRKPGAELVLERGPAVLERRCETHIDHIHHRLPSGGSRAGTGVGQDRRRG